MKVIIAGAGIAGPVAAIALRNIGIAAEILEARDVADSRSGLFLTLASNGNRVLDGLGLTACIRARPHIPTPRITFLNAEGKQIGSVSNGSCTPNESITLMRHSLHDALSEAAEERGVVIQRGIAVTGYRQNGEGVTVLCNDGSKRHADLLIGADGIGSRVRGAMPGDGVRPAYSGIVNVGGIVPRSGLAATEGEMRMVWGRQAFFGYAVGSNGDAWWFANIGEPQEPARGDLAQDRDVWADRLSALFANDLPLITGLIDSTSEIHAWPVHDLPHVPRWSDGRVVLIGDAAHATAPSSGQGASLALEDAAFLAVCLRDIPDPGAALARFETMRRPRAERIVTEGRRRGAYKAPRSWFSMRLRDALMPFVFRFLVTERSLAWIHDYRVPQRVT